MKIQLLFPPHWNPVMPHLALPTLTAYLRAQGLEVAQRDLNVEVFDAVLTRDYVTRAVERLRRMKHHPAPRTMLESALADGPQLAAQVETAKTVFRSPAFFAGPTSLPAFLTLIQSLQVASLPFYPAALELTRYVPHAPEDSRQSLMVAARDPQHNLFLDIFRRGVLADLKAAPPDIVAISVPTLSQMLAAVTLAHLIKVARLPCHVTLGGPHISMLREQLPRTPELFDWIDSAIVFGGEVPLTRLVETLAAHGDLSQVPNLIYRDGRTVKSTPVENAPYPNLLPDFAGLPLDRYLTPTPVLPLLSTHGCYHGKCGFCNVGYGGPQTFCQIDAEQVVGHMLTLREKYGARHIFFADEAFTPHNLNIMATKLADLGAPIHWCGCARFDHGLTPDLLAQMAAGGCRMLLFGLETAAEPTIRRMVKGTQPEEMSRILRQSAAAGIWNHAFFFFGFPGEMLADAQETVNFVYAHQDAIHSASPGAFLLERYAPAHREPAKYNIRHIHTDPVRDLAIYFDYEAASGIDAELAETIAERLLAALPYKQWGQFYSNDIWRFLYASDLRERGKVLPLWLESETS